MLSDLASVLETTPSDASLAESRAAITEENVLAKKTASNRRLTAQRLSEIYGLDAAVHLFRHLRFFWELDDEGRPLLACRCANARDPLSRMTASHVL